MAMYKLVWCLVLAGVIGVVSCNRKKDQSSDEGTPTQVVVPHDESDGIVTPSDSGIIKVALVDGKGTVKTHLEKNQTVYFEFVAEGYKNVTAELSSSDEAANIRFAQIILPNGNTDGPFGDELSYPLQGNGVYQISVDENMMAGDPWKGVFEVEITLTK